MKIFIGILVSIIVLTAATLAVLATWNILPFPWEIIWKSGITIITTCSASILIYLFYHLFFKKHSYNKDKGNKAHPIN